MIQLATPGLLLGLFAVALPLVIHWLLRPRPRRTRFPAAMFLREALAEGRRVQRVRSLWLLLVRMLLVGCVAFLLAAPSCPRQAKSPGLDEPVVGVIVLDDSWSTMYRGASEETTLDWLRERARDWTRAAGGWPAGSTLGLVAASGADPIPPTTELNSVRSRLRSGDPAPHAKTLADAVRTAGHWLSESREPVKRLIVLTDLANHSWRDVRAGALAGIKDLRVDLVAPDPIVRTNLVLESASGPERVHPTGAPIPLHASVRSDGVDAMGTVVVSSDDRVIARSEAVKLPAGVSVTADVLLPPMAAGVHGVTVTVEPADRLLFDQTRFVAFETGPRPVVWLLAPDAPADDLATLLTANLLAPESLAPERQRVTLKRRKDVASGDEPAGDAPALIVMMSGTNVSVAMRATLRAAIEQGATLLLMPRSGMATGEWAGFERKLIDAQAKAEVLAPPSRLIWSADALPDGDQEALSELSRAVVRRRVGLGKLRRGVRVYASYDDQSPAIVSARMGQGRVILMTSSPDPAWSDLGSRAAGLLAWLHELIDLRAAKPDRVLNLTAHEDGETPMAGLGDGSYDLRPLGDGPAGSSRVLLAAGVPQPAWPTDQPGLFAVAAGDATRGLVAINWPVEESDPTRATVDRIGKTLGLSDIRLSSDPLDDRAASASAWMKRLSPDNWLAGALLVLLGAEPLLAWRERKNPCADSAVGTGS